MRSANSVALRVEAELRCLKDTSKEKTSSCRSMQNMTVQDTDSISLADSLWETLSQKKDVSTSKADALLVYVGNKVCNRLQKSCAFIQNPNRCLNPISKRCKVATRSCIVCLFCSFGWRMSLQIRQHLPCSRCRIASSQPALQCPYQVCCMRYGLPSASN